MQMIIYLVEQMNDEIDDAESYYEKALEVKDDFPNVTSTLIDIANQEIAHFQMLHNRATDIINKMKSEGKTIDEGMMYTYNYLHSKLVKHVEELKYKLKSL